jgi:2-polyprenyl-3-methyl-5-hydroxy-6-metoxy-1,4-benzoquinol methylase
MALQSMVQRRLRPELMDRPELDLTEHVHALRGLRRLNIASGACRRLWREIVAHTDVQPGGHLRILDVASGGGDIALGLWALARRRSVEPQILGLDISPTACAQASQRCNPAGTSITFQCTDVTSTALPKGFDVVTSSLFLHHLSWEQAVTLLSKMGAAGGLLIVSDLRRSAAGYAVAHAACRIFTRSRIVRYDGPQSVANAFTCSEMVDLCREAGLPGAMVRRTWPWRLMVIRQGR